MVTKWCKYAGIVTLVLIWANGLLGNWHRFLFNKGIFPDDFRYGDLYRLSLLPEFKSPKADCIPYCSNPPCDSLNMDLYVIGDSFLEPFRINEGDFRVKHYHRFGWYDTVAVKLDTKVKNVLIIETVERNVRDHIKPEVSNIRETLPAVPKPTSTASPSNWFDWGVFEIKSVLVEERLERSMFSYDVFLWFKELKAKINQKWFGRVAPQVSVLPDHKAIFLLEDTDASQYHSSFNPMDDAEVNQIVTNLNATYNRYKAMGFDEIFLSIIPNKVSIVAPDLGEPNHAIERIQHHPDLKMPAIDTYGGMKKSHEPMYDLGDTHWTCQGRLVWLRATHAALNSLYDQTLP
ncbi:MAG: hypothetical protein U0Y10_17480 [Spirosomataceae bacterium]